MAKQPSFSRQDLLQAAMRVAQRVGLDALSMRMVAHELGVTAMAVYRYVPNRDALVAWIADEMASEVRVPSPGEGSWEERLRLLERAAFRADASVHGQPVRAVIAAGPNMRRIVEGVMEILRDAGFDEEDSAIAFEVIWAYYHGQLRVYERLSRSGETATDTASPQLWPSLAKVIDGAPSLSAEEYFDRGFEILLAGLRSLLEAKA